MTAAFVSQPIRHANILRSAWTSQGTVSWHQLTCVSLSPYCNFRMLAECAHSRISAASDQVQTCCFRWSNPIRPFDPLPPSPAHLRAPCLSPLMHASHHHTACILCVEALRVVACTWRCWEMCSQARTCTARHQASRHVTQMSDGREHVMKAAKSFSARSTQQPAGAAGEGTNK